jgi:hypothetical protein
LNAQELNAHDLDDGIVEWKSVIFGTARFLLVVSLNSNLNEFGHPWIQGLFHVGGTRHGMCHAVSRSCKIIVLVESNQYLFGDPWIEWQL